MGADGLGDPLNDNLGFGGHQGLANFPGTTNCGGVCRQLQCQESGLLVKIKDFYHNFILVTLAS